MTLAETSDAGRRNAKNGIFSRILPHISFALRRRESLDLQSMPDDLLRDIGLSPDDRLSDWRDINLMNASIRSGIILPRPC